MPDANGNFKGISVPALPWPPPELEAAFLAGYDAGVRDELLEDDALADWWKAHRGE